MRRIAKGYGVPPKWSAVTTLRHGWRLDREANTADALDIHREADGGIDLESVNDPVVQTLGVISKGYAEFNGSDMYFKDTDDTGNDAAWMDDDITVMAIFRVDDAPTTGWDVITQYGVVGGAAAADNCLFQLAYDCATNKLRALWEHGNNVSESHTFDLVLARDCWHMVHIKRWDVAAGAISCSLYYWGELTETDTAMTAPDTGTSADWHIGAANAANFFDGDINAVYVWSAKRSDADIREDARRALLLDGESSVHYKVETVDGDGGTVNLSAIGAAARDWFVGVDLTDSCDGDAETAVVQLRHSMYEATLAKWHDNKMNRLPFEDADYPAGLRAEAPRSVVYNDPLDTQDAGQGSTELLDIGRAIEVYFTRLPIGIDPYEESAPWNLRFDGQIDAIDWAKDPITLRCSDLGGVLIRGYIETAFDTADGATGGCGANSDPLETVIQDILTTAQANNWIPSVVTLNTPTSPSWCVRKFTVGRVPVMQQIQDLAAQLAWLCKYRFDEASGTFKLTLYEPTRVRANDEYADISIDDGVLISFAKLSIDRQDIRNVVRVVFPASTEVTAPTYAGGGGGLNEINEPTVAWVQVEADSDLGLGSESRVGRVYCEITEGSNSEIDEKAEAETLAVNVCRDLAQPDAELQINCRALPEYETGDRLYILADEYHTTAAINAAVFTKRERYSAREAATVFALRGKPTAGSKRHINRETRLVQVQPAPLSPGEMTVHRPNKMQTNTRWDVHANSPWGRDSRYNLLTSPGFEAMSFGPAAIFDGWSMVTGAWGTDIKHSTTTVKSGKWSAHFAADNAEMESNFFPLRQNQGVIYRHLVYPDGALDQLRAYLDVYDDNDENAALLGTITLVTGKVSTVGAWNTLGPVFKFITTAGAKYGRVRMKYVISNGTEIFVDGCSLTLGRTSFKAYQNNLIQVFGAAAWTKVQFNAEAWDFPNEDSGGFDSAVNYRYTVPADGEYRFQIKLSAYKSGASTGHAISLYKNGVEFVSLGDIDSSAVTNVTGGADEVLPEFHVGPTSALRGDYFEVYFYATAALNTQSGESLSFFKGERVDVD